jgi:hypothetical protein
LAEQHASSDAAAPPSPGSPGATASDSVAPRTPAPPSATATASGSTRVVALVINGTKIVKTAVGGEPLYIDSAAAWQPNRAAIEAKYPWLSRQLGIDGMIGLALQVMAL